MLIADGYITEKLMDLIVLFQESIKCICREVYLLYFLCKGILVTLASMRYHKLRNLTENFGINIVAYSIGITRSNLSSTIHSNESHVLKHTIRSLRC